MWNFIKNIKLKKEQKRIAAEQKVLMLKTDIKRIKEKANLISNQDYTDNRRYQKNHDNKCPKCGSTNVNDRIKRIQGSLNGGISGHSSFFGGSMYDSIKGELDTNEVNKCECGHEWKKYKFDHNSKREVIEDKIDRVRYALSNYYKAEHCKFNPLDLEETYLTKEEKQSALNKEKTFWDSDVINFWSGTLIDTLLELVKEYQSEWNINDFNENYNENVLIKLGFVK